MTERFLARNIRNIQSTQNEIAIFKIFDKKKIQGKINKN